MGDDMNSKVTLSEEEFCKCVGISRTTAWRMRNARSCRTAGLGTGWFTYPVTSMSF
jgi:hypothetical protein